jgi:hypothetical protein
VRLVKLSVRSYARLSNHRKARVFSGGHNSSSAAGINMSVRDSQQQVVRLEVTVDAVSSAAG